MPRPHDHAEPTPGEHPGGVGVHPHVETDDHQPPPPPEPSREPGATPVLLLPIRLETRFGGTQQEPELWLRVYPDQVHVDAHEPEFTSQEVRATHDYWEALWRAGPGDSPAALDAWRALAGTFGATRAAYLAQAPELAPTNPEDRPAEAVDPEDDLPTPPSFPPLPAESEKADSWSRAPRATCLAHHWTVVLYRGGAEVGRATTEAPVRDPLSVGPDPNETDVIGPDGLALDDEARWLVDFDEAINAGMALRIPITPVDLQQGFDRVLVFGLCGHHDHDEHEAEGLHGETAAFLELLTAKRFTEGLAFVPQGSATNNTADAPAAYASTDSGFERSYAAERLEPLPQRDAEVLRHALDLPADVFEHLEHADRDDQGSAHAMALAVWPATLGYYLLHIAPPALADTEPRARTYFLERVRARGPLPALRVGEVPYGVLPATSLALFDVDDRHRLESELTTLLRRLLPVWERSAAGSPHVTRGGDPDEELVAILGMDASAQGYRSRHALGEEFLRHTSNWLDVGRGSEYLYGELQADVGRTLLERFGYATWDPRVVHLALTSVSLGAPFPIVQDEPVSETEGLVPVTTPEGGQINYISWLRTASVRDLRDDVHSFPGPLPQALLYKVLRQALLVEFGNHAYDILIDAGFAPELAAYEREFVHFTGETQARERTAAEAATTAAPTVWEALAHEMPGAPELTVARHLEIASAAQGTPYARLGELRAALDVLAALSSAELERLFTETLDTFSHRLDPWITSLATKRLTEQRAVGVHGIELGGFGWVEDLRAKPLPPLITGERLIDVERFDERKLIRVADDHARLERPVPVPAPPPRPPREPRTDGAGFLHAPSLTQAAVGAVLRNGYLTHRGTSDGRLLAIDLSSSRVRLALELLQGVRNGQPLAALLGYRVERALHDARLDKLVQPLRDRFPLRANRLTEPPAPVGAGAASEVVHGVDLHQAWSKNLISWTGDLEATSSEQATVNGILLALDDALDALGDLSISESVYQLLRGNYGRAGGLMDAISRGERPPDPDVVRTPRSGVDLTHRLVLLLTPGPTRSTDWPGEDNPRAAAEPALDAWASTVLPDPGGVRARVAYLDAGIDREVELTLFDLGLGPLDALTLADAAETPQASELEQRILYEARQSIPEDAEDVQIVFAPAATWPGDALSVPDFLVAARVLRDLLGAARPLAPPDLIDPERQAAAEGGAVDIPTLSDRAADAIADCDTAAGELGSAATADQLRSALLAASLFGVSGSIPVTATGAETAELAVQADSVREALEQRCDAALAADAAFDRTAATEEQLRDHLVGLMQAIFGPAFRACPPFTPPDGGGLDDAFDKTASLVASDPDAPARWLHQLTYVRPGVARWDAVCTLAHLLTTAPPAPRIAQLPAVDPDRWLGLPFDGSVPTSGRVSITATVVPSYNAARPHAGLMLDEWPERIPRTAETTGMAFNYDQPTARPPQAFILAVCPDERPGWDDEALTAVLNETLDLAKVRTVDLDSLTEVGQILPALYFPFNAAGETLSIGFIEIG